MRPLSLYIHIPFCKRRCPYCTFYHVGLTDRLAAGFVDSAAQEFAGWRRILGDECEYQTVFVGGGTPSVLGSGLLERLFSRFMSRVAAGAEITIEVNPEDVTAGQLDHFVRLGVNRVSLGIQSMDEDGLKHLDRCDRASNLRALQLVSERFTNYSVDLLLGVPHADAAALKGTVDTVLEYAPAHISAYCLEPGGVLASVTDAFFDDVDEDRACEEYLWVVETLTARGYEHYEVSNFARPGSVCRHNRVYWSDQEYAGVGPGAHSYVDGERLHNPPDIFSYIHGGGRDLGEARTTDPRNEESRRVEALMLALRTSQGIAVNRLMAPASELATMCEAGLCHVSGDRMRLTGRGYLLLNDIVQRLDRFGVRPPA